MNREDEIFGQALDLPADARAGFIERSCGQDQAMRERIEALLDGYEQAGDFLEASLTPRTLLPTDEKAGDTIGRYTLIKKIGEGGCGSVYLAEQQVPVRRRVAFKIIKLGMDTHEVIRRFEGERQALAMMDHPDIARVLDAGATETGRPYFAMEYVDGVPIHRYCDERALPIRARLELFARVCLALQHAHQKGIIHRDVKPSNILITEIDGQPAPKVIDFGIAKATQGRLTEQTLFTGVDQFIGTPAYMSPEQVDRRDVDIDTRSDIYSLGVLLYELLVGHLPFERASLERIGVEELRRIVREADPPRLSARLATLPPDTQASVARQRDTTPAALAATLRDDLDWIALRCLEKERARRYASAQELADDVRRHLRHEPVEARPPSTAYRTRRFVARHRLACASAAAIALTLIAATVVSVRQAVRATRAEQQAKKERDIANAASDAATRARADAQRRQEQAEDFLTFMLGSFRAELKNVRVEALHGVDNKAMAYFDAINPRDLTDTVLARQAKALYQIGETRMEEARYNEAAAAFTASYARASALVERHPRNGDMLFERAQAEYWLGFVARRRGDFTGAREWLTRYRDSALALFALEGRKLRAQNEVTYGYHNLAVLDVDLGDLPAAQNGFIAERTAVAEMAAANPNDTSLRFRLADIASWLGTVAERDGRFSDALTQYREYATRLEELAKAQPTVPRWRLRLADAFGMTGELLAVLGRRDEALAAYARSKSLREALVTQDPANRQWQHAALRGELRQLHLLAGSEPSGQTQAAILPIRQKLEALVAAEPSSSPFAATLAAAWRLEARLRFAARQPEGAGAIAAAVRLAERLVQEARADNRMTAELAQSCLLAGRIAHAAGDVKTAQQRWEQALAALTPLLGETSDWQLLDPAAQALSLLGRTGQARLLIERLQRLGYQPLDPLAASLFDAASMTAKSNLN